MAEHKIYSMSFGRVYLLYINKVERKDRTKEEVDQIISWLTGYDVSQLKQIVEEEKDFRTFFKEAPQLNPNRKEIKGVICGIRVEEIEEPLMQEIRYMDKLIDELAKGKKMEAILRS